MPNREELHVAPASQHPARSWAVSIFRPPLLIPLLLCASSLVLALAVLLHPVVGPELRRMLVDRYLSRKRLPGTFSSLEPPDPGAPRAIPPGLRARTRSDWRRE